MILTNHTSEGNIHIGSCRGILRVCKRDIASLQSIFELSKKKSSQFREPLKRAYVLH